MRLFESAETKRIKFLLKRYFDTINDGAPDDIARLMVTWEFTLRGRRMFDDLAGKDIDDQKKFITEVFQPLDIGAYDIVKLVSFIISVEFPKDEKITVENLRNGTTRLSVLNDKVGGLFKAMHQ